MRFARFSLCEYFNIAPLLYVHIVNDFAQDMFRERLGTENLSITYLALSGAIAGTCQVIATNPMEVVKINMQMAAAGTTPPSYGKLISELGIAGLYRGVSATLLRYGEIAIPK